MTFVLAKPFFFNFLPNENESQAELILPALADPAAEGDHAYPVPLALPQKLLGKCVCLFILLFF